MKKNIPTRRDRRHPFAAALASVLVLLLAACGGGGAPNAAPQADAGGDATVPRGATVLLDGSGSTDADGDALTHAWSLVALPDGSGATLAQADSDVATFVADVAGTYEARLTVSDGALTAEDHATVEALDNAPPVADAGADRVVAPGDLVRLDGGASSDPDGDAVQPTWSFVRRPDGSGAALDDPTSDSPSFTADEPGEYELRLTVSDGAFESVDGVLVTANRAPAAIAGPDTDVRAGELALLDGSASSDPDGDPLSHAWRFLSLPDGSAAVLTDAGTPAARFEVDVEGPYLLELTVDDGHATARDRVTIQGVSAGGASGSTLYVAPDGDDAGPGTQAQPLATVGAALAVAEADATVQRVRLSPGTYAEPFDTSIGRDLAIVGPEDETTPAILDAGANDLLAVTGDASLSLVRLTLRSDGTALHVGNGATLSLASSVCEAATCVASGTFLVGPAGGRVTVTDSTLRVSQTGVRVTLGDGLTLTGTRIEGAAGNGLALLGTPTLVSGATFANNGIGADVAFMTSSDSVSIMDSRFEGNDIGLRVSGATGVEVRESDFIAHRETGILVQGEASLVLASVDVLGGASNGVVVGPAPDDGTTSGETVTLRDSSIRAHDGHGLVIRGDASNVDLGTASQSGGNTIDDNMGSHLSDVRPDLSSGLVTVSGSVLGGVAPSPGTRSGPYVGDGIHIENENEVYVF